MKEVSSVLFYSKWMKRFKASDINQVACKECNLLLVPCFTCSKSSWYSLSTNDVVLWSLLYEHKWPTPLDDQLSICWAYVQDRCNQLSLTSAFAGVVTHSYGQPVVDFQFSKMDPSPADLGLGQNSIQSSRYNNNKIRACLPFIKRPRSGL